MEIPKRWMIELREDFFEYVVSGEKNVEGRLFKGKFIDFKPGDILTIKKRGCEETIEMFIASTHRFLSFEEMLLFFGIEKVLPSVSDIDEGVSIYREFYSEAEENQYGVLALSIEKMDQ